MNIGFLGAALSHPYTFARTLRQLNLAQVSGLWATEAYQGKLEKFAHDLKVPIFSDCEQAIDESDAVIVTTQTHLHKTYAQMALKRGTPVFVDKPMATCYADAADIVETARSTNTVIMSSSVRRFTPIFSAIADEVRAGRAGRPLSAVRFEPHGVQPGDWQDRVETSGGFIFNFGIHVVDTLQAVLGPEALQVHAFADKLTHHDVDSHDSAVITIRFANGAVGTAQVLGSMHAGEKMATAPTLDVFCTDNSYTARFDENQAYEFVGSRLSVSPYYELLSGAGPMMQAFVNAVQTGEPAIDYDEMLQVIAILDATRTSAAQGRQVSISDIR